MINAVGVVSVVLIFVVLLDAFEAIVLPRRVSRRFRLTRIFYRSTWIPASALARRIRSSRRRETFLGFFGPLSLIMLLSVWALGLIVGFAMLHWSLNSRLNVTGDADGFGEYLYLSGSTFFTLGYGDVTPSGSLARGLAVVEAGLGFGFLALIIGYLPVIYQAFSRRETSTSLLDARAGSPPTASELLRRHGQNIQELDRLLMEWERWSAELLESHLSYPVLCYYRSQHNNQSWLAALTAILDTSALVIVGVDGASKRQAQLTFAMARHAVVDLAQTFHIKPRDPDPDRLPPAELTRLRSAVETAGVAMATGQASDRQLSELRRMYEPFVNPLAGMLLLALPPWVPSEERFDNWQTSKWGRVAGINTVPVPPSKDEEEHF